MGATARESTAAALILGSRTSTSCAPLERGLELDPPAFFLTGSDGREPAIGAREGAEGVAAIGLVIDRWCESQV
jgi:hypothetical protein